jgi:tetratricopeptide (TPR) repeat protein
MRRLTLFTALLVATTVATGEVRATEPTSATTIGPQNPALADGATALDAGRVEDGIRLTLDGLKAPTDASDKAAGYANLCAGYAMLKQWDEALGHCNTSLSINSRNWRAYNNRAAIYVAKGQYELALADLRAGLDIAPESRTLLESLRITEQNQRLYGARSRSSVRSP